MSAHDDDDVIENVEGGAEPDEDVELEPGAEEVEPDVDDLDEDELAVVVEDEDEEAAELDDEVDEEEAGDDEAQASARAKKRREDEDEDDDDLLSPDDVEADLDRILKDRMVTADEEEEDEDEEIEPDERGDGVDRLQPKRADEQLCPSCFLLVRATAPACPVGDDACPIFS